MLFRSPIPFRDETIDTVFAFHFLEHFAGKRTIELLREIERCLKVGGTANIVVPYYRSNMAFHDLDHKCFFTEDTFKTLFSTPYYDKNRETVWKLEINVNIIIGVAERNLCLMTQLVKKA